ncbi:MULTISPECIES: hypothetical protein [Methylorubrum]|uniref:hypothetical protein n=1 Tax=Methylorubrum TaxID=2282523 RepID=UPI001477A1D1|nr:MULTISPECIES: hypothetical protein [Methylorubrum]MCP1551471.1 hypothetical protein [Methylorubrum zatmanii]MCP1556408.1 hypothetical protein [Methylorubrum extorquens]MCP1581931.1 hypothetical protein [Methylorubrum extorquens]
MAFLQEADIRARARRRAGAAGISVPEALGRIARNRRPRYDIFLSQTIRDAEIVLGVYDMLTNAGYDVFCDWIEAPETDRSQVTPANAEFVRTTMGVSDTLLFLDTVNAAQSLWMCWELGWFDGRKGLVAVLPVLPEGERYYRSREFLGLYPYVELDEEGQLEVVRPVVTSPSGITLFEAPNSRTFESWRNDPRDFMRPRVVGGAGR